MDNSQQFSRDADQNDDDRFQQRRRPSLGVQAAYDRLRQVRRDLLELSDNLHARIAAEENLIGPGYEAIVLTEPSTEEGSREQLVDLSSTAANTRSGNPTPRTLSHPVGLSLPLVPVRPPRRWPTMGPSSRLARDMDPDDPNTLLGRHVAAQVAERANHPPSNSPPGPMPNHPLRTDGVALHSQQDLSGGLRRNMLSSQALVAARAPIPSRGASETQRSGAEHSGQQVQTDRQDMLDRLSLLSNFSVRNFSTPRSGTLSRPLIFEEPMSYVDQDTVQYSSTLDPLVEGAVPARSYVVHRRLNTDGEEYVHNINLHWSEDEGSSSIESPAQQHRIPSVAGTGPQRLSVNRRGWARLDPDGDEISEVEEQPQHSRAAYRAYDLQRARREVVAGNENIEGYFNEWEELGDEYNMSLNSPKSLRGRSYSHIAKNRSTSAPFRPNPLPMPLIQMVDNKISNTDPMENDFVIFLPYTARLAGR